MQIRWVRTHLWYADLLAFPVAQALPGSSRLRGPRIEDASVLSVEPRLNAWYMQLMLNVGRGCRLVRQGGMKRINLSGDNASIKHLFLQSCETIADRWSLPLPQIVRRFTHWMTLKLLDSQKVYKKHREWLLNRKNNDGHRLRACAKDAGRRCFLTWKFPGNSASKCDYIYPSGRDLA